MKRLALSIALITCTIGWSQSLSIDFESTVSGMQGYDGATFTTVSNPNATGNNSSNVGKIVKVNTTDLWAGGKITGLSTLNFNSASNSVLSLKFYTNEPVGTVVKIKLESPYTSEVDAVTTVSGAWETLLFDFGIPAPTGSVDLVIMPQPHTAGGGNTFYVDDIQQVAGVIATPRSNLPITFQQGTTAKHFFSFESAIMTTIANPDVSTANSSSMVGKIVRYLGAPYGGSKITFSNNLDFANHPEITMKVWTTAPIGTNVTLKAEKPFWGEERSVLTTKTGEWETLTFSFSGAPLDMPTLTFLFDFTAGSTSVGDGSENSTFLFDDVKFANVPLRVPQHEALTAVKVGPNPSTNHWVISELAKDFHTIRLYDLNGKLLNEVGLNGETTIRIDATEYPIGQYFIKISGPNGSHTITVMKK
jgi:hypothetical protein